MNASNTRPYALWLAVLVAGLVALAGCQGGDGSQQAAPGGAEVGMTLDLTALLDQVGGTASTASLGVAQPLFTASDVMLGTLEAHNTDTGTTRTFNWSVYLEAATLAVQSNKTIVLDPGTYDFAMVVSRGDHTYAGEALGVTIADGTNDVPLTLAPVIGDTVTDVLVVRRLVDFRFSYDPGELAAAGITDPHIGIRVDGGPEQVFLLNAAFGVSQYMHLNLLPGSYQFQLALYDGSIQRGKSVPAQEAVTISPGVDLHMDLVALHGETTFALSEAGGDATFVFNIPAEIVNEVGGTGNLAAFWRLNSPRNGFYEGRLDVLPDGAGNYTASVMISPFDFDTVDLSLIFSDITFGENVGDCSVAGAAVNTPGGTFPCAVTLRRRSLITGTLLATLGVNAFSTAGEPVAGAKIYANGVFQGITGGGAFGTAGYRKLFLPAGSYTIRAMSSLAWGQSTIGLSPLGIDNVDVSLDRLLLAGGAAPIPFSPEPMAANVLGISNCDDCTSGLIPLGFEFAFFGNVYDAVNISTNGFMGFDAGMSQGCCNGRPIPAADSINNIIAPAWTDLYPPAASTAEIRYEQRGTAPNRRFVVNYVLVPEFYFTTPVVTTQVIFFEADSSIEMHTSQMSTLDHHVYTQGVENADGTAAFFLPGRVATNFSLVNDGVRFGTH